MTGNRGYIGVNRAAFPGEGVVSAGEHHLARLLGQRSSANIPTAGLWAHFRAGQNVTESAGQVTSVASLSGSVTLAPIGATPGPFTDGAINGNPAWRYAGGQTLRTSEAVSLTDWAIYLVARPDAGAQTYERLLDHDFTNGFWWGRNGSAANSWGGGVRETADPYGRFAAAADGSAHVLGNFRTGTSHSLWVNGGAAASGTVTATATGSNRIGVGCWHNDGTTGQRLNGGLIAEVLIYNVAHDTATRTAIMATLAGLYGL